MRLKDKITRLSYTWRTQPIRHGWRKAAMLVQTLLLAALVLR